MTDREFWWWEIKTWLYHLWGAHSWVPREEWRVIEGNVEIEIIGFVCWRCPAVRDLDWPDGANDH